MKTITYGDFYRGFVRRLEARRPLCGQIELTYKCGLNCPYCYLKPYLHKENDKQELALEDWKRILDVLALEGCMELTFTGGDPLLRGDFKEIYLYARKKGFIITVFTNAISLEGAILEFFRENMPFSIELTLNSLKEGRFDLLTGVRGDLGRTLTNIQRARDIGLPLVLKTNALKINQDEITGIKGFAKRLLGEKRFKLDTYVFPALNGDKTPVQYRLTPGEIVELEESDVEIREFLEDSYHRPFEFQHDPRFLYQCNTWHTNFFIDPYGILRFCHLSSKYSTDLREKTFQEGFYDVFPLLSREGYKTDTRCRDCEFFRHCMVCPARGLLETGDEEAPVEYFCELAKARAEQEERFTSAQPGQARTK